MKYTLTINSGSSSLKFKVFSDTEDVIFEGQFKHYKESEYLLETSTFELHEVEQFEWDDRAILTIGMVMDHEPRFLTEGMIVHRIVHGGEEFSTPTKLTPEVVSELKSFNDLAPLHNPIQLEIITRIQQQFPQLLQYGIFDTAFHKSIPKENFLYALPLEFYDQYKVRRYGFHGISHKFIAHRVNELVGPNLKIISCHLGSGSSISAIQGETSIDNSFGFSPDENMITSTRVGEVDYDALLYLKQKAGLKEKDIERIINKESGLLGLSGYTFDMLELVTDYNSNDRAKLAIDMYVDSAAKYIYQMFYKLQGCDVLVFTGGIGAGSDIIREKITKKLTPLKIFLHEDRNRNQINVNEHLDLTADLSEAKVCVIPTDEELQMLREVREAM